MVGAERETYSSSETSGTDLWRGAGVVGRCEVVVCVPEGEVGITEIGMAAEEGKEDWVGMLISSEVSAFSSDEPPSPLRFRCFRRPSVSKSRERSKAGSYLCRGLSSTALRLGVLLLRRFPSYVRRRQQRLRGLRFAAYITDRRRLTFLLGLLRGGVCGGDRGWGG